MSTHIERQNGNHLLQNIFLANTVLRDLRRWQYSEGGSHASPSDMNRTWQGCTISDTLERSRVYSILLDLFPGAKESLSTSGCFWILRRVSKFMISHTAHCILFGLDSDLAKSHGRPTILDGLHPFTIFTTHNAFEKHLPIPFHNAHGDSAHINSSGTILRQ